MVVHDPVIGMSHWQTPVSHRNNHFDTTDLRSGGVDEARASDVPAQRSSVHKHDTGHQDSGIVGSPNTSKGLIPARSKGWPLQWHQTIHPSGERVYHFERGSAEDETSPAAVVRDDSERTCLVGTTVAHCLPDWFRDRPSKILPSRLTTLHTKNPAKNYSIWPAPAHP